MDEKMGLTVDETEMVTKAIAKMKMDVFTRGVIEGAGAIIIGIGIGHLMIWLPKAIKNRKKKTDKQ